MGGNALAEKSVASALTCPIKKLRRQQNVARRVFFLQTSDRRHANDPADVEGTKRINIRPMIQFMRQNPVSASVSRQKVNAAAEHCSADDRIGGRAERRLDLVFGQARKTFQMIEATAADNSDGRLIHGRRLLKRKRGKNGKLIVMRAYPFPAGSRIHP